MKRALSILLCCCLCQILLSQGAGIIERNCNCGLTPTKAVINDPNTATWTGGVGKNFGVPTDKSAKKAYETTSKTFWNWNGTEWTEENSVSIYNQTDTLFFSGKKIYYLRTIANGQQAGNAFGLQAGENITIKQLDNPTIGNGSLLLEINGEAELPVFTAADSNKVLMLKKNSNNGVDKVWINPDVQQTAFSLTITSRESPLLLASGNYLSSSLLQVFFPPLKTTKVTILGGDNFDSVVLANTVPPYQNITLYLGTINQSFVISSTSYAAWAVSLNYDLTKTEEVEQRQAILYFHN